MRKSLITLNLILAFSAVVFCQSPSGKIKADAGAIGFKQTGKFVDHGLLKVDNNKRYFVFEDGTPYVPVGLNHHLIYRKKGGAIDSMMRTWSDHGVNYLRIWVGIGADPETSVGQFDEKQIKAIDTVIYFCEKYGIYLNICLWNENSIAKQQGSWGWNGSQQIYNKANNPSGTTYNPEDIKDTLDAPTWAAMKNRYAYFVERWKNKPIIIMWDLVNDCWKTDAWKAAMYDYVKKIDGTGRLVTLQYNTGVDPRGEMDCGSVRVYGYNPSGNNPELMMKALAGRIKQALTHGDPVYAGEGGMDYPDNTEYAFERGFLHFTWGPLAAGAAGNLHPWVSPRKWPELTEKKLMWIKNFSDFCSTINWSEFNSRNADNEVVPWDTTVTAFACRSNDQMLIYLMRDDPADKFETFKTKFNITSGLDKGKYELTWIDIRTGKKISSRKISGYPATLETPEFKDALFGLIKKISK